MTNDECLMTKEIQNPKSEVKLSNSHGLTRFVIRHSTFDIRHS
jgi:hypothetical protein